MTGVTLFSGVLAPEQAAPDIDWKFCAEVAPEPAAVIAYRKPNLPNLGDVTDATFIDRARGFGPVDIAVFGSPCQGFSVAGKRLGLDDPRSNLALVALGIVKALRPRWFLFENVAGLLSSGSGRDMGAFLGTVAECGYFGAYRVLDAQFFGVPQRRRRVFFVGHSRDWRCAAAVLFEPEGMPRHHKARGKKGQGSPKPATASARLRRFWGSLVRAFDEGAEGARVRDVLKGSVGASPVYKRRGGFGWTESEGVSPTLTSEGGSHQGSPQDIPIMPVAFTCKDHGADAGSISPTLRAMPHDSTHANGGGQVAACIPILEAGARTGKSTTDERAGMGVGDPGDPMFTLQSGKQHAIAFTERGRDEGRTFEWIEDQAYCLTNPGSGGRTHSRQIMTPQWAVRRLTPVECERLQGMPDNWTLIPWRGGMMADGPRYKMIGNSMAVPNMRWILDRVKAVDEATQGA